MSLKFFHNLEYNPSLILTKLHIGFLSFNSTKEKVKKFKDRKKREEKKRKEKQAQDQEIIEKYANDLELAQRLEEENNIDDAIKYMKPLQKENIRKNCLIIDFAYYIERGKTIKRN